MEENKKNAQNRHNDASDTKEYELMSSSRRSKWAEKIIFALLVIFAIGLLTANIWAYFFDK